MKFSPIIFIILVVAVVVGLFKLQNPNSETAKSVDQQTKNTAQQFLSANQNYFSKHNAFPWQSISQGGMNCYHPGTEQGVALSNLTNEHGCLQTLIDEGELDAQFIKSPYLSSIILINPNPQTNNANELLVCFLPKVQKDADTKYLVNGQIARPGLCQSQGGAQSCYRCMQ
jgi:hypothetical protein